MANVLDIERLSVSYGRHEALSDISFHVAPGDYLGIVGPNGSGKTTLVKTLLGLLSPTAGSIRWHGGNDAAHVGYLPQKGAVTDRVFPAKVREVVAMGTRSASRWPYRISTDEKEAVREAMALMGVSDLADKRIGNLSGGQQQRVFLARALAGKPSMLILDEPTSAMDPVVREDFYNLLQRLNQEQGMPVLLVSHDVATIGKYTSSMLYLDRKVVFFGNYEDFCHSHDMTEYFGPVSQHQICWRHHTHEQCTDKPC